MTQDLDAADAADRFIGVWKMFTNVARAERAQNGIGDGVRENIGIGMSFEPALVRNFDAAENEFTAIDQAMRVVTDAATKRAHSFRSITPLEAMML